VTRLARRARFEAGDRVVVVGSIHSGRRGVVVSAPGSWADRMEIAAESSAGPPERIWVAAYLVEPEAWEDR
jgi:hypothetical protein